MSRLIDADRLLFDVSNAFAELHIGKREILREDDILKMIYNAPVAEEHPVKHGRWIIDTKFGADVMSGEQMVICSVCGRGIFWGKQRYCPNCGALMSMDEVEE